jgi:iron complex outermembrane recepter protein
MNVVRVPSAVIALCFVLATSAAAQDASLEVRVADPDRAAITNAAVVLMALPSGDQLMGVTRNDGTFRFSSLAPGEYRVEIVASNFSVHSETVMLGPGMRTVNVTLQVASIREDITVEGIATVPTIGRISAPLRDQPLTVNTLTSQFIEARALNDLVSALKYIPNVATYSQYGVYQYFTFRGISDSVQMVDGIRNEGNRVNTQLANVERLEVLKGPSSVLYGGDAIGAAVNIVLKKPTPHPVYDFSGAAGRWDTYRGSLGAGGRLRNNGGVLYRLDIGGESATNFRHDPSKRLNVTPSVTWRLSRAAQLDARYFLDRNRVSGDSGIPLVPLSGGFIPDLTRTAIGDPLSRAVQGDGSDVIPKVPSDFRYNTPQDFGLATDHNLRLSYSHTFARSFAFRNTVGYRRFDDEYWIAEFLDVTPPSRVNRGFLYFAHHREPVLNQAEFSGQVRLGVTHDFLAGWDYQYFPGYTNRRGAANFNTTPLDLYDPVETHVPVNLDDFPVTRRDHQTNRTNGIFFQDTVALTQQVKVVAGGRFDQIRRNTHNNPVANGVETEGPVTRPEYEKFTHRLGLVYQPTVSLDLYAQNSSSFRPNFTIQADGSTLEPEYGEQYEVGQRLRLMQERLQLSTAVFNLEKRNVARNLGGGVYEQIGKVRARGVEAEVAGLVTSAWQLTLGYGFTDATFLDYFTGTGAGIDLSGNTPRRAPEHTVTFSTSYAWRNGLSLSAGGQIVSEQFINDTNTIRFSPYELLDVGASYTTGRMQYALNLTNVTGRQYWTSSLGNRQLYPGQPFNVLATVRVRMN